MKMNKHNLPTINGDNYDYRAAMYEDIKNAIVYDLGGLDEIEQDMDSCYSCAEDYLQDELWTWDSVTGNGSGSYWLSAYRAQCALVGNLDILGEAIKEFDADAAKLCCDPESADVTIRCYLLGEMIAEVCADLRTAAEDELERETQAEMSDLAQKNAEKTAIA